jgi:hypothetical protein
MLTSTTPTAQNGIIGPSPRSRAACARFIVRPARPLPALSALTCHWHIDPDTGRLAASWSLETVEDLTHCCRKSRFTGRAADTAPVARAA